jgi:hypothetical protein
MKCSRADALTLNLVAADVRRLHLLREFSQSLRTSAATIQENWKTSLVGETLGHLQTRAYVSLSRRTGEGRGEGFLASNHSDSRTELSASTLSPETFCTAPLGHLISTLSKCVALPRPKVSTDSDCDR